MSYVLPAAPNNFLMPGNPGITSPQDFVVPQGLVAYWPLSFDTLNFANNTASDLITHTSDGTISGITSGQLVDSSFGAASGLAFAASIPNQITTTSSLLTLNNDISICYWFESTVGGTPYATLVRSDGGTFWSFIVVHNFGGSAGKAQMWPTPGGNVGGLESNKAVADGFPHHIVFTRTGSTGSWPHKCYIDGKLDNSSTITSDPNGRSNEMTAMNRFGSYPNGYYGDWTGADMRVYNRALDQTEVMALYRAGLRGQRSSNAWQYEMPMLRLPTSLWQLYFSKNAGAYEPVTTTSVGVKSADASSDADETKILIPRL